MAGESRRRRLRELLKNLKIAKPDLAAYDLAFVHQSAAGSFGDTSNQRLEFLGDAILGAIVADWLYEEYPGENEGELTRRKAALVTDAANGATARRLGFAQLLHVSPGLAAAGGPDQISVLADAFEAFVAALFLRDGMKTARRFVVREHLEQMEHAGLELADPKTALQEIAQRAYAVVPVYIEEIIEGPPHRRVFTSTVSINGEVLGRGSGPSKKAAQRDAAAVALPIVRTRQSPSGVPVPCG